MPATVRGSLQELRDALRSAAEQMTGTEMSDALRRSVGSMRAGVEHRLHRLERRFAAEVKRRGSVALRSVAIARASLYPFGVPQERVLSFAEFLARYGDDMVDVVRAAAREHVMRIVARG